MLDHTAILYASDCRIPTISPGAQLLAHVAESHYDPVVLLASTNILEALSGSLVATPTGETNYSSPSRQINLTISGDL